MTLNLSKSEIFEIVRDIIAEELDIAMPRIDAEVSITEICDEREIDLPVIIYEIEREFGVDISDSEMEFLETVDELVNLIEEKIIGNRESI
ncbi:MAG: hypothetical protein WC390_06535 [Sulfurimonas sp.]|jgi:acyl carrier protein